MADYDCWPLWNLSDVTNVDPNTLPLSEDTREALCKWAQVYDRTLNQSDPIQSGFETSEKAIAFNQEGWRLWNCVRRELESFKIVYFDNELGKVFEDDDSRLG